MFYKGVDMVTQKTRLVDGCNCSKSSDCPLVYPKHINGRCLHPAENFNFILMVIQIWSQVTNHDCRSRALLLTNMDVRPVQ